MLEAGKAISLPRRSRVGAGIDVALGQTVTLDQTAVIE
jgi:hypothetical protein